MRRMEKITGRSDDMLIIRGVNVFPDADRGADPQAACSSRRTISSRSTRPRHLDELTVLVERAPGAGAADARQGGRATRARIKSLIGVTADVRVVPAGGIERSIGKAKRVVDKRARE